MALKIDMLVMKLNQLEGCWLLLLQDQGMCSEHVYLELHTMILATIWVLEAGT